MQEVVETLKHPGDPHHYKQLAEQHLKHSEEDNQEDQQEHQLPTGPLYPD